MALVEVEHLTGGYTKRPVLKDISFAIEEKQIVGLIGLNGAGKSTTIKHITGLMHPKQGTIKINGHQLVEDTETYRKQFSYIPETPVLYEELTLKEHLELTGMAYGISEEELQARMKPLLKEFRLEKKLNWFPAHFSKGMKQKVMIMSAFLIEPKLYIIDEPFVGLDPLGIQSLLNWMDEMRSKGASILMSTHILATAEKYCDTFIIIHQGEIRAEGTLKDLQTNFEMPGASLDEIYIQLTKEEEADEDDI
ncbi:TPA: ABC transporter ATP-binding protein [Listeria monocytogenes]|uniref:ABC transporter ATP-binding protein n=6 Tax=Listeria monocytogenes TaxID=1639 RepID=A0A9P2DR97_LISMN|nr:ABC transporter ATP-binding protein [Listeria monocytogenes]EAD3236322.1 ABC transporter ATP-binding protein [Listeria monocytogenes CFSAN002202]EAD5039096.1 ABC transporter ATP-binding protein [Listeria monocytogenes serotype 1/2a]EAE6022409.1 ABC transporter ATP-binding protein [Listeria monocytogenes serotype 3a]EAF4502243.1 ABC transporter ATP-binding protein [Listeria monocytogenes serotype 4b]EAG6255639.1 ABC transporter ATP-binding protein [Listeria monocytogenes CFSAN003807]EAG6271